MKVRNDRQCTCSLTSNWTCVMVQYADCSLSATDWRTTTVNCRLHVAVSLIVLLSLCLSLSLSHIYMRRWRCNGVFWDQHPVSTCHRTLPLYSIAASITDNYYDNLFTGGRVQYANHAHVTVRCKRVHEVNIYFTPDTPDNLYRPLAILYNQ